MGTRKAPQDGILTMDPRLVDTAHLAPNTAQALTSSYTEAGPRPGKAVPEQAGSRLAPIVSGAQEVAARAKVIHSGLPALGSGAALAYRLESEADTAYRGWAPPNWITGWCALRHTSTTTYASFCAATHPATQQVVAAYYEASGGTSSYRVWDPHTWAWTSPGGSLGGASASMTMLALPTGRILHFVFPSAFDPTAPSVFYTDDIGDTWSTYADDALQAGVWGGQCAAVYLHGDIAIFVRTSATADDFDHFVSTDLGHNFADLGNTGTVMDTAAFAGPSACVVGGRILVGYIRTSDRYPVVRILGSASQAIETAPEVEVDAAAKDDIALMADPDGTVWCYVRDSGNDIDVYVSFDAGDTWEEMFVAVHDGSAGDYLKNLLPVATCGYALLLCNWTATTAATDGSVGGLLLGGWANVVAGAAGGGTSGQHTLVRRTAFGRTLSWLPIELPSNNGWTLTGTAGTLVSPGEMDLTTAGASGYYTSPNLDGTDLRLVASFDLTQVSGLSSVQASIGDGAEDYYVIVTFSATGWTAEDTDGNPLGNGSFDVASGVQVLIWLVSDSESPNCRVWLRARGSTVWTLIVEDDAAKNTSAPTTNSFIRFGKLTSGTQQSTWRHACAADEINHASLTWQVSARLLGKPLTSTPAPIPALSTTGQAVAWLSVQGGPGRWGEEWTIPPRYDYPIEALFSGLSPSPAAKWRSTSKAEQIIAFDLGSNYDTEMGGAVALVALGANFRTAYLEYSNGGAWTTLCTLDLTGDSVGVGKEALTYTCIGDWLYPAAGTDVGERYLFGGELAGGTVITDLDGTPLGYRIVTNTPGTWQIDNTSPKVRIQVEGVTGPIVTPGDAFVYHPSGLTIESPVTIIRERYWRIRIPSAQYTAEDYFEAGHLGIYRVRPFGADVAWGASDKIEPNVAGSRSRYGTTRVVQQGPPAVTWSMAWSDGEHHTKIRRSPADLDHYSFQAAGVGPALVAVEDAALQLWGIMEECRSGEIPVVAVRGLQDAHTAGGGMITDRSRFIFGRLGGSIGITHSGGVWGDTEALRVESIQVEEIK